MELVGDIATLRAVPSPEQKLDCLDEAKGCAGRWETEVLIVASIVSARGFGSCLPQHGILQRKNNESRKRKCKIVQSEIFF